MKAADYVMALRQDPERYAIIPKAIAGKALQLSRSGIETRIASGRLETLEIGSSRYLLAQKVAEALDKDRMVQRTTEKILVRLAKRRRTITYGELMQKLEMSTNNPNHRNKIGTILYHVSKKSLKNGILLSVLVHRKSVRRPFPSPAFFELAHDEGFEWADDAKFVEEQTRRVWLAYAKCKS